MSRRHLALAAACALAVSAVACRKNPAGDGPYASEVADAVPRIEKATGLKFKTPPKLDPARGEDLPRGHPRQRRGR